MIKKTNNQPTILKGRLSVAAQNFWAAALIGSVCGSNRDQHRAATRTSHTLNKNRSLNVHR